MFHNSRALPPSTGAPVASSSKPPPPRTGEERSLTESGSALTMRDLESYSGGNRAPPNWLYYPSYMIENFRSLSKAELDERDRWGLNSLPESQPPFQLDKQSTWKTIIRAVIMGSPQQKLHLDEIKLVLNARFPYLLASLKRTTIVRQTLSSYRDFNFNVTERYWTVVSCGSTRHELTINDKGNPLGYPAQKMPVANRALPSTSTITLPPFHKANQNEALMLPSCRDLIQSVEQTARWPTIDLDQTNVPRISNDIIGCRGLMDMVNNDRVVDLKTLAQRCGQGLEGFGKP